MVALPTMTLLMGVVEIGLLMVKEQILEGATRAAAREVRTGQVQTSADAVGTFTTAFCKNLVAFSCAQFYFDVRTFADFPQIVLPQITFNQNGKPTNATFTPGGAGTVVTVRVVGQHHFFTPMIGTLLGGSTQTLNISSTAVMRTEPFGS